MKKAGGDLRKQVVFRQYREWFAINLFQKSIEPRCAYCSRGRDLNPGQVVCSKKGVMSAGSHCEAFRYDPLKRVPPRPAKLAGMSLRDEDFQM